MDFVIEVIVNLIFNLLGAAVRWIFLAGQKNMCQLLEQEGYNYFVSISAICLIILMTVRF